MGMMQTSGFTPYRKYLSPIGDASPSASKGPEQTSILLPVDSVKRFKLHCCNRIFLQAAYIDADPVGM